MIDWRLDFNLRLDLDSRSGAWHGMAGKDVWWGGVERVVVRKGVGIGVENC